MAFAGLSRILFALTMIAIGAGGVIEGGFFWHPLAISGLGGQFAAYIPEAVSILAGAGLLLKRTRSLAALVLLGFLIVWTAMFKLPPLVQHPLVEVYYQSIGENFVLIAAAWVLLAQSAKTGGLRLASVVYALALVAFGLSHFFYLQLTAPLVPHWLHAPVFWAYLTGCLYLVAGAAILSGAATRAGALLAAVQISFITLLVWVPKAIGGQMSLEEWGEPAMSWALTTAAWVIAASFGNRRWFNLPALRRAVAAA